MAKPSDAEAQRQVFLSDEYIEALKDQRPNGFNITDAAQKIGESLVELALTDGKLRLSTLNTTFNLLEEAEEALPNYFPRREFSRGVIEQMARILDEKNQAKLMDWALRRQIRQNKKQTK